MEEDSLWIVEFQDGHLNKHFQASQTHSAERVIDLMVSYLHGEESWRDSIEWEPTELP